MKEILYIQAGNLANYVGTHFWNTQENYLASEDPENALIDASISFRNESVSSLSLAQENGTLCPRLLSFDWKGNFGTLARDNALGEKNGANDETTGLWTGAVQSIRQPPIERSVYQESISNNDISYPGKEIAPLRDLLRGKVRYWSDYNRLYYLPRSLQPVNEPSEWDRPVGNWGLGQDLFRHYNEENDLMDGSVRLFLEECDALQGIQVINDCGTFGGFTASFLTAFQDDYRKTASVVFPLLSGIDRDLSVMDVSSTRAAIGDALYLRSLDDIASLSVPVQPPEKWSLAAWRQYTEPDKSNPYYTSAIVAPYIESATLPSRLNGGLDDLASLAAKLQLQARSSFSELSGRFPLLDMSPDSLSDIAGFSIPNYMKGDATSTTCRIDVTRGFSGEDITKYEAYVADLDSRQYLSRYHSLAYPLPTSFPSFLWSDNTIHNSNLTASPDTIGTITGFASLSTTGRMSGLFKKYATFAESCLSRRTQAALDCGIDFDELRELANDLWTIHDNCGTTENEHN